MQSQRNYSIELRRALVALANHDFFGALTLRMDIREDPKVKTGTADGMLIRYNPRWFNDLSHEQRVGWLAQKGLQCASRHHLRMIDRDTNIVNIASQLVVNPQLIDDGFVLPDGYLIDDHYRDMAFERVCNLLELECEQMPQIPVPSPNATKGEPTPGASGAASDPDATDEQDGDSQDAGGAPGEDDDGAAGGRPGDQDDYGNCGSIQEPRNEDGGTLNSAELNQQKSLWEEAAREAEAVARRIGNMPGSAHTLSRHLSEGQQDWREIMRRFLQSVAARDYSWNHFDRRFVTRPPYGEYIPSLHTENVGCIGVGIDCSASVMTKRQVQIITDEMNNLLRELAPEMTMIVYWDTIIQHVEEYSQQDYPIVLHFQGHGGTKCSPFFQYIDDSGINLVAALVFTDLEIDDFPYTEPPYPVLWCSTGRPAAPFGEVVLLDKI